MRPELEDVSETGSFERLIDVDPELKRLEKAADDYGTNVQEISTDGDFDAYVKDDVVFRVFDGIQANSLERNRSLLNEISVPFPSGVYWAERSDDNLYTVVQSMNCLSSGDLGFWEEFNDNLDRYEEIGLRAAEQGIHLDFDPQNFGIMNGELVYDNPRAVVRESEEGTARYEMAGEALIGASDSVKADEYGFQEVAKSLDERIVDRFKGR